jgi:acetyltransferase-like isoleucine patch superfamily enzyme
MGKIAELTHRLFRRRKLTMQERFPQHEIGRHSYGDIKVRSWREGSRLRIGAFCSFAAGVEIFLGGEHRTDWVTTFPFPALWPEQAKHFSGHPRTRGDVVIGNDVWLGAGSILLSGICIGDGAVVGARAVVTRNVPPYAIVAGNPARIVRMRFTSHQVERLLALKWWQWDDERITQFLPLMLSENIDHFLDKAEA